MVWHPIRSREPWRLCSRGSMTYWRRLHQDISTWKVLRGAQAYQRRCRQWCLVPWSWLPTWLLDWRSKRRICVGKICWAVEMEVWVGVGLVFFLRWDLVLYILVFRVLQCWSSKICNHQEQPRLMTPLIPPGPPLSPIPIITHTPVQNNRLQENVIP